MLLAAATLPVAVVAGLFLLAVPTAATLTPDGDARVWLRAAARLIFAAPVRSILCLAISVAFLLTCLLLPTILPFVGLSVPCYLALITWSPERGRRRPGAHRPDVDPRPKGAVVTLPDVGCDIVLDLRRPHLVDELFDAVMLSRLERLGRVHRHHEPGNRHEGADILVTGWDSPPLTDQVRGRTRLVVHSAGSIRGLVPKSMITGGLRVSHAPTGMARSVAELCLYYTLALLRDLHLVDRAMSSDHDWAAAFEQPLGTDRARQPGRRRRRGPSRTLLHRTGPCSRCRRRGP